MKKIIVVSLGGSVMVPQVGKINVGFLKKFKELILKLIKKDLNLSLSLEEGKPLVFISNLLQK